MKLGTEDKVAISRSLAALKAHAGFVGGTILLGLSLLRMSTAAEG